MMSGVGCVPAKKRDDEQLVDSGQGFLVLVFSEQCILSLILQS
jgi:hypothetical protein